MDITEGADYYDDTTVLPDDEQTTEYYYDWYDWFIGKQVKRIVGGTEATPHNYPWMVRSIKELSYRTRSRTRPGVGDGRGLVEFRVNCGGWGWAYAKKWDFTIS